MTPTVPEPCRVCHRGTGRLVVGHGRGELLVCPACAGTGTEHAQTVTLTPHEALVSLAALGDPTAHTHIQNELSYPTQAIAQATAIKKLRAIAYATPHRGTHAGGGRSMTAYPLGIPRERYCHDCGWSGVHYEAATLHNPGSNLDDCPDCGSDLEDEPKREDDE